MHINYFIPTIFRNFLYKFLSRFSPKLLFQSQWNFDSIFVSWPHAAVKLLIFKMITQPWRHQDILWKNVSTISSILNVINQWNLVYFYLHVIYQMTLRVSAHASWRSHVRASKFQGSKFTFDIKWACFKPFWTCQQFMCVCVCARVSARTARTEARNFVFFLLFWILNTIILNFHQFAIILNKPIRTHQVQKSAHAPMATFSQNVLK